MYAYQVSRQPSNAPCTDVHQIQTLTHVAMIAQSFKILRGGFSANLVYDIIAKNSMYSCCRNCSSDCIHTGGLSQAVRNITLVSICINLCISEWYLHVRAPLRNYPIHAHVPETIDTPGQWLQNTHDNILEPFVQQAVGSRVHVRPATGAAPSQLKAERIRDTSTEHRDSCCAIPFQNSIVIHQMQGVRCCMLDGWFPRFSGSNVPTLC